MADVIRLMSEGGGSTAEHAGSVFDRSNLRLLPLTLIMIGLILFTMLFEKLIKRLDVSLAHDRTSMHMLTKVYKELMILGFISFMLLVIIDFITIPEEQLHMFEFAHVWIFLIALLFVAHAVVFIVRDAMCLPAISRSQLIMATCLRCQPL
jgi:hypothetical protein